jgi:uncharacterized membrane protein YoaK (UPF0700 family)
MGVSAQRDITETLWPPAAAKEDGLPPLLIVLTIVTGVVDALAYLRLGHVFVANMTGNVVFLGFAAAGAGGLSVPGSLLALAFFLCGGIAAGRLAAGSAMTGAMGSAWPSRSSSSCLWWRWRSRRSPASTSVPAAATP